MMKAYRYRIYPTDEQKILFRKNFGCSRFVYNHYLDVIEKRHKATGSMLNYYDCAGDLKNLKAEYPWLKEADSTALQSSLRNLESAFKNMYEGRAEKPKRKSKKYYKQTYTSRRVNRNIEYCGRYIKLPKVGMVKTRNKLTPYGDVLSATVIEEQSGNFYVVLTCSNVEIEQLPKTGEAVGLDLGIKSFAVFDSGEVFENPKYFARSEAKLAKMQRQLSLKSKDSSNSKKLKRKIDRLHEHIANQRRDFLQKLSTDLIRRYDVIYIEDLKVKDLMHDNNNAKNIGDASWSEFVRELMYKAEWYGKKVVKIDTYYPSSQLCSMCGYRNEAVKELKVREWICPVCGVHHDRDHNAAINIRIEGVRIASLV